MKTVSTDPGNDRGLHQPGEHDHPGGVAGQSRFGKFGRAQARKESRSRR